MENVYINVVNKFQSPLFLYVNAITKPIYVCLFIVVSLANNSNKTIKKMYNNNKKIEN